MRTAILLGAALCGASLAAAAPPAPATPTLPLSHPPIAGAKKAAPSPWSGFADYALSTRVPNGGTGSWTFRTFADPGDSILEFDTPQGSGRTKGAIILVGGGAIAIRGFTPEPGFEMDPLDVAILQLKLVTALLDRALPGGPASLKGSQAVSAHDDGATLLVSTPTANAGFDAPWRLQGEVERTDASAIAFRLDVESAAAKSAAGKSRWSFSGKASGAAKDRRMDDATSLAGWTAYALGPAKPAGAKSHSTLRFGTTKLAGPFATVGDLRAYLARPAPPGAATPR
jgi:hypothetical protein